MTTAQRSTRNTARSWQLIPAADTPPPATPTGIDYLRLLEDRHTRAMGERLRYAQLADPTHLSEPAGRSEPTGPVTAPPDDQRPDHQPTADNDGLRYDTDLLGLAAQTHPAATDPVEVTG